MEALIAYMNSLCADEQKSFAASCGTTVGYLRKAASAKQKPGPQLCIAIERESKRAVTVAELRPDFAAELQRSGYTRSTPTQDAACCGEF